MSQNIGPRLGPHSPDRNHRIQRMLGGFYLTGNFWYRAHHWMANHAPSPIMALTIKVCAAYCSIFFRHTRRAIVRNLDVVLGPCSLWKRQGRAYRTFREWGWVRTERWEQFHEKKPPIELEVIGKEHWDSLFSTGEGFVLLTAHVGNYESGNLIPGELVNRKLHVVREPESDSKAQQFLEDLLGKYFGSEIVTHFVDDDMSIGLVLLSAIRKGDLVGLPVDRPRMFGRKVEVSLFGQPFPLPDGPPTLARTAGVPMMSVFLLREGRRRYRLYLRPPITAGQSRDRKKDLQEALTKIATDIEWCIREKPNQWFCFADVFTPVEGSSRSRSSVTSRPPSSPPAS